MCKPPKPEKPDLIPEAPPPPEEPPVAPEVNEDQTSTDAVKRKGRKALRIDLNPAASGAVRAGKTGLAI